MCIQFVLNNNFCYQPIYFNYALLSSLGGRYMYQKKNLIFNKMIPYNRAFRHNGKNCDNNRREQQTTRQLRKMILF